MAAFLHYLYQIESNLIQLNPESANRDYGGF